MQIRHAIYRHSGPPQDRRAECVSIHHSRIRAERLARRLHIIRSATEVDAKIRWSVRQLA